MPSFNIRAIFNYGKPIITRFNCGTSKIKSPKLQIILEKDFVLTRKSIKNMRLSLLRSNPEISRKELFDAIRKALAPRTEKGPNTTRPDQKNWYGKKYLGLNIAKMPINTTPLSYKTKAIAPLKTTHLKWITEDMKSRNNRWYLNTLLDQAEWYGSIWSKGSFLPLPGCLGLDFTKPLTALNAAKDQLFWYKNFVSNLYTKLTNIGKEALEPTAIKKIKHDQNIWYDDLKARNHVDTLYKGPEIDAGQIKQWYRWAANDIWPANKPDFLETVKEAKALIEDQVKNGRKIPPIQEAIKAVEISKGYGTNNNEKRIKP